jgi:RHS repeat-associated protein
VIDQSFDYAYTAGGAGPVDAGPNLDRVTDHRDASESRFYFYDALDRLWKSTTLAGTPLYTYTYDANGNRTQEIAPAGTTTTTYSAGTDRIAQASGAKAKHYAHDAYGSRIWAGPTAYAGLPSHVYNELNRLVELRDPITQAVLGQYTYDAFGRRVRELTASGIELFFYDATGHLLEERSLATAPHTVRDYAWIEEEPVGTVDSGPQPTQFAWVHTDRLGTPLAVTSSPAAGNAATIWRASYEPFGLATVNEDADGDSQLYAMHLRFPGQRWDAGSGGHYNFFRDYDPSIGRYTRTDPVGLRGGLSTYAYADLNPVERIDPTGLEAARIISPLARIEPTGGARSDGTWDPNLGRPAAPTPVEPSDEPGPFSGLPGKVMDRVLDKIAGPRVNLIACQEHAANCERNAICEDYAEQQRQLQDCLAKRPECLLDSVSKKVNDALDRAKKRQPGRI